MRRRLAASASRAWVSSFSSTSSSSRAAFQSCGDTVGGMFMGHLVLAFWSFSGRDIAPLTQRYVEDQKSIGWAPRSAPRHRAAAGANIEPDLSGDAEIRIRLDLARAPLARS